MRLWVLFGIILIIGLLRPLWGWQYDLFYNTGLKTQLEHLRQVEDHIHVIRPKWNAFTNQNAGFEQIYLFPYTGEDGTLGVSGSVSSEQLLSELHKFLEGTSPPRPIVFDVLVLSTNQIQTLPAR